MGGKQMKYKNRICEILSDEPKTVTKIQKLFPNMSAESIRGACNELVKDGLAKDVKKYIPSANKKVSAWIKL